MLMLILVKLSLFLLSFFIPFIGVIIPYMGIKQYKSTTQKNYLVSIFIISVIIMLAFGNFMLMIFINFYCLTELLYWYLKDKDLKYFDKISLASIISFLISFLLIYLYREKIFSTLDLVREFYINTFNFEEETVTMILSAFVRYSAIGIFTYLFMINLATYVFLHKLYEIKWKISFYLLLPYITVFFISVVMNNNNIYIENLLMIAKVPFIFYGVIVLKKLTIRWKFPPFVANFLLLLIYLSFQEGLFWAGGILSIIENNNRRV